jgi:hypothetical protein
MFLLHHVTHVIVIWWFYHAVHEFILMGTPARGIAAAAIRMHRCKGCYLHSMPGAVTWSAASYLGHMLATALSASYH